MPPLTAARHRVVVLGAGFGGLAAVTALRDVDADVTVVDKRNYHLFQPLLYQVATAGLSPADIAAPIRSILARQANARVVLAKIEGIDKVRRIVETDGGEIAYDTLVVATGARHAYFGNDQWERHAPGLKKIEDATAIRRRLLLAFERAETCGDAARRRALLTFVVIGGGPTGVEMAGAIAELARKALARDFRTIDPRDARIVLIEAGPRLLAAFPAALSGAARQALERLGVEVRTGQPVSACDAEGVAVGDERIATRCVVWAAGVAASPAARWLAAEKDRAGRVVVGADLTLPGHPEILVVGDTAAIRQAGGAPVPGIAPAAKQAGLFAAAVIAARLAGRPAPPAFVYRHAGDLATIGRGAAVAGFGRLQLRGATAWWLWGLAHVWFLIGFRNRLAVMTDWLWSYLTYQRGARLITGDIET
ncbi:MAG: NAD(P)/FAD-dependent oxidoreductase [Alphaproteobacteria bacterium]|nr:NAD(P)/FAD-dependent oxidoreductase [Alphaproteobacteria bacterium]